MEYMATSINQSPVVTETLGADIENIRGKAVKFNPVGNIILAGKGEAAVGIGAINNDTTLKSGDRADIQVKDMGLVLAGAAFAKGAELAANKDGAFAAAAAGDHVLAIALEKAQGAGVFVKAILTHYEKPAAASAGE